MNMEMFSETHRRFLANDERTPGGVLALTWFIMAIFALALAVLMEVGCRNPVKVIAKEWNLPRASVRNKAAEKEETSEDVKPVKSNELAAAAPEEKEEVEEVEVKKAEEPEAEEN